MDTIKELDAEIRKIERQLQEKRLLRMNALDGRKDNQCYAFRMHLSSMAKYFANGGGAHIVRIRVADMPQTEIGLVMAHLCEKYVGSWFEFSCEIIKDEDGDRKMVKNTLEVKQAFDSWVETLKDGSTREGSVRLWNYLNVVDKYPNAICYVGNLAKYMPSAVPQMRILISEEGKLEKLWWG